MRRLGKRQPAAAIWTASILATSLAGCAGAGWLESPSEADLPLEATSPYPTALATTAHLDDDPTGQAPYVANRALEPNQSVAPGETAATSMPTTTDEAEPTAAPAMKREAIEQPQSSIAPLGVVPPHLRSIAKIAPPAEVTPIATLSQQPAATVVPLAAENTVSLASASPALIPASTAPTPPAVSPAPVPPSAPVVAPATAIEGNAANPAATIVATTAPAEAPTTEDRQRTLEKARTELIAALEAEIRDRRAQNAADAGLPRLEQQLRLLYLAADRLDDAAAAVESLDGPQREAYKHLMFGLGVWLSPDEASRAPLRTAKALRSLRDATAELATGSKLELRKLAFCERVEYFGWYTEFPRNEFRPKEQVILYVEVDNFSAEKKGPEGFETELQGSYQIFDERGQIVAERQLPLDRETCRNFRRDYFLAYPIYMPDQISPGRYRLELTIEDRKASSNYQGRKLGEGLIEFSIRQ